jgi:hypothetical protein
MLRAWRRPSKTGPHDRREGAMVREYLWIIHKDGRQLACELRDDGAAGVAVLMRSAKHDTQLRTQQ